MFSPLAADGKLISKVFKDPSLYNVDSGLLFNSGIITPISLKSALFGEFVLVLL